MESKFWELFEGFPHAYGSDSGGCVWEQITDGLITRHLRGEEMIGVYPMVYDPYKTRSDDGCAAYDYSKKYAEMDPDLWYCKWGAIDIDEGEDSIVHAQNASTVLEALAVPSWVERSRSKGCHVWVFAEDWVKAPTMRKALQAACQIAEIEYDAVYPKQDSLSGPPGNYMRLPYGGERPKGRQTMIIDDWEVDFGHFLLHANENRAKLDLLETAAGLWKDPTPDLPPPREYSKEPLMQVDGTRLRGVARSMYNDGPHSYYTSGQGAGRGRHGFLNRFARAMWEAGYAQTDILTWTKDLDGRLGQWWTDGPKFIGRQDCDRQLRRLVTDARGRATIR